MTTPMWNQRRKEILTLVVVFAGVVLMSAFVVYYLSGGRRTTPDRTTSAIPGPTPQTQQPDAVFGPPDARTAPAPQVSDTFIDRIFGSSHSTAYASGDSWAETMGRITV